MKSMQDKLQKEEYHKRYCTNVTVRMSVKQENYEIPKISTELTASIQRITKKFCKTEIGKLG